MCRGLQLASCTTSKRVYNIHAINFGAGEQARLLTSVLGSVVAQEQATSIAEGSATAQQVPQGPYQPQNFADLSGRREKLGASRQCALSSGYAMAPLLGDYRFCFLIYSWKADRNNLIMFKVCCNFDFKNDDDYMHYSQSTFHFI